MNTISKSKLIVACLTIVMGGVGVIYQNFTPHKSITEHDVSNLYMNSALSTALKTKAEQKQGTDVAFNARTVEVNTVSKVKRAPDSAESTGENSSADEAANNDN